MRHLPLYLPPRFGHGLFFALFLRLMCSRRNRRGFREERACFNAAQRMQRAARDAYRTTRPCARHACAATRRAHVTRERRDVRARVLPRARYHCSATTTHAPCASAPLAAPCAKTCAKRQRAVRAASRAHTAREVRARRPCLMSVRTEPRSESEPLQSGKRRKGLAIDTSTGRFACRTPTTTVTPATRASPIARRR
jgi:hypothetical protein